MFRLYVRFNSGRTSFESDVRTKRSYNSSIYVATDIWQFRAFVIKSRLVIRLVKILNEELRKFCIANKFISRLLKLIMEQEGKNPISRCPLQVEQIKSSIENISIVSHYEMDMFRKFVPLGKMSILSFPVLWRLCSYEKTSNRTLTQLYLNTSLWQFSR